MSIRRQLQPSPEVWFLATDGRVTLRVLGRDPREALRRALYWPWPAPSQVRVSEEPKPKR